MRSRHGCDAHQVERVGGKAVEAALHKGGDATGRRQALWKPSRKGVRLDEVLERLEDKQRVAARVAGEARTQVAGLA